MASTLRLMRQAWALTLEQAAAGIMHPITLSRMERGLHRPRPAKVRALARRYRVSTQMIMDRWLVAQAQAQTERARSPAVVVPMEQDAPSPPTTSPEPIALAMSIASDDPATWVAPALSATTVTSDAPDTHGTP